ncbi:MAG: ABC transporter ATP-binding protein, partial [Oscillospiraceae bacterium]|nr:ABC transporter ATP-binding protein [Oscillospiraceae bacterium]
MQMALVIAVTAAAQWIMNACNNHITYGTVRDIRQAAMKQIERLPLSYLDKHPTGETVSRIIADVDTFADGLLMGFTQFFTGILTIGGTLFLMLAIHKWVALVVILLTPLSLFVAAFIAKNTSSLFRKQSETRGQQTTIIEEMV